MKKHGLGEAAVIAPQPDSDIIELDAALLKLEANNARRALAVKLRYFAGMTVEETATAMGVSTSTVDRDWTYARAWLFREMNNDD